MIGGFLFSANVYADQPPALVASIQNSPYYYAEGNFGLDMLRYFDFPLTPYLTDGVTEESSDKEIMDAYYKANADKTGSVIEQESDRAISYVLHIQSPEIFEDVSSYNFQLFNPETNPYQFTLESLSSKDKQIYYEFASRYINAGKRPDPFDATIDIVTGDGTVLQKWQYFNCEIIYFETYLQNNLTFLMFAGGLVSEIRDHSEIECSSRYMQADMDEIFNPYVNFKGPAKTKVYQTEKLHTIPSTDDRAMSFLVSFVGREIPEEVTFQTFQQFGPLGQTIPQVNPYFGTVASSPQFYLESLVSKDKKGYYEYVSRYINAGKTPEVFDVNVDLVTGDGTALLRWQYFDCKVTSFETYLQDSVLIYKFHPSSTPEIRDRTEFYCGGDYLEADFEVLFSPRQNLAKTGETRLVGTEPGVIIPKDDDRAMSYVVHFANGPFDTTKTIRTFAKYEQNGIYEFDLQSLPSQDKNELYDVMIAKTLNLGKKPDPFSVTVDLVAGDETILQKWQYYKCEITNYQIQLSDNLLNFRFVGTFVSEIRDKFSFECVSLDLVADPLKPVSPYTSIDVASPTLNPTSEPGAFVPTDESRAMSYVVTLVGQDITPEQTFSSFGKFNTHGSTVQTPDTLLVYNKQKPAFTLESLPSKDKEFYYHLLSMYINAGKEPEPFDVTVDIVSGDNTILQTWQYFGCQMENYEVFLQDTLVTVKFNPSPAAEIRDTTGFVCTGFNFGTPRLAAFSPYASLDTLGEKIPNIDEKVSVVPSDDDRPMSYIVKFSGGEAIIPHTWLTFSKFKQTGNSQFWLESLPSQDKEDFYDLFVYRHINPGKHPELIDASIDLVTGDGTILQSWQYHKCGITDYIVYLHDNSLFIPFTGTPNPEIRDRITFDCGGVNIDIEGTQTFNLDTGLDVVSKVPGVVVPPHIQLKTGVPSHEVECKKEMELMYRPSSSLPYCVKQHSVTTLQEKGWEYIGKRPTEEPSIDKSKIGYTNLKAVLPKNEERAMSYQLNVVGRELPEIFHNFKFSKFAPFTTNDITIPTAHILGIPIPETATISLHPGVTVGNQTITFNIDIAVEDLPLPIPTATIPGDTSTIFGVIPSYQFGDAPGFYMEGLPAKDKAELYGMLNKYVNPGKRPDPIDIGVQLLDGNGNALQSWNYRDCLVFSYQLFVDENILMMKFHEQWQSEIKDRVMFTCSGLRINEL